MEQPVPYAREAHGTRIPQRAATRAPHPRKREGGKAEPGNKNQARAAPQAAAPRNKETWLDSYADKHVRSHMGCT